ncbi:MAG: response regulator [Sulfurimonadaceae bacterium]|jgi:CheY-like chemotaxis protein/nitrogen-specific signal transduction histidine kinase|nr:response regulator [Sulfurimonadaceae bacterium]
MALFSFFKKEKSGKKPHTTTMDYKEYFSSDMLFDIINSSSVMMLVFSKDEGWIGANKAFYDTFNFEDISGFRQSHESIREIFHRESEEVFTEDDKSWLDYIKKYKKDGYSIEIMTTEEKLVHISAKVKTFIGSHDFYLLELHDVSKLHISELKTQETEKLKTKFLANIGHEFRTPMNGILGFVELLNQTHLDQKQQEYLNMISRSSKTLMSNIEVLLDLSQLQGGRLQADIAPVTLLEEMEKIVYEFTLQGKGKGVNVLTFIDPKIPKEILSDGKKIRQVMESLIKNAIKFTSRGGRVTIEVKMLKRQVNGDCTISFSVKDNGKGMAAEQIALVAEPFTAGNQADERLGVGLSLSHGIVNILGGELKIQSQEGVGSVFSFTLSFKNSQGQSFKMAPKKRVKVLLLDSTKVDDANLLSVYLRSFAIDVVKSNILDANIYEGIDTLYILANQADSSWMLQLGTYSKKAPVVLLLEDEEKLQTKLTHIIDDIIRKPLLASSVSHHLAKLYKTKDETAVEDKLKLKDKVTALVVEDNLINQRLIKILLQEYGIVVQTAANGNEAVAVCEQNNFDIIFMDIDMPEKNGIIATHEIKESRGINKRMPIVALTAMAMDGDKEMLLGEGLDDYIAKPLTREKLERILDKYLKTAL